VNGKVHYIDLNKDGKILICWLFNIAVIVSHLIEGIANKHRIERGVEEKEVIVAYWMSCVCVRLWGLCKTMKTFSQDSQRHLQVMECQFVSLYCSDLPHGVFLSWYDYYCQHNLFPSTLISDELCKIDEVCFLCCRERLYIQFRLISAFNGSHGPIKKPDTKTYWLKRLLPLFEGLIFIANVWITSPTLKA
jgi:hypothetical protein